MFINKASDNGNNICGTNIAAFRKELKISQRELADRLHLLGLAQLLLGLDDARAGTVPAHYRPGCRLLQ